MAAHRAQLLHVVEGCGGGLADAIISYAAAVPDTDHHILYSLRPGITVEPGAFDGFVSATPLPEGHLARIHATRTAARALGPCIVHAHSSYAGVYTRVGLSRRRVPILYTPHCFSFERGDLSRAALLAYAWIERALASRTSEFVACSPREAQLARAMGGNARATTVVNVPRLDDAPAVRPARAPGEPFTVAMTGRLAPQKGVDTFAALARATLDAGIAARFVWIGGGDMSLAAPLQDAGVRITGWIDHDKVLAEIARTDLYVHTSEWEGFPIALLEAVGLGTPAVALSRGYSVGLPDDLVIGDAGLIQRVGDLIEDASLRSAALQSGRAAFAGHTADEQSRQLREIYHRWDPHRADVADADEASAALTSSPREV